MSHCQKTSTASARPSVRRLLPRASRLVAGIAIALVALGAGVTTPLVPTVAQAAGGDTFSVTVPPQPVAAGAPFVISVTAVNGGPRDASYAGTAHFTSSDPGAVLPPDYKFTTGAGADDGAHTFSNLVLRTPGAQTITVTDTSTSSITGTATVHVHAGAVTQLVFVNTPPGTMPPNAAAGSAFSGTVRAEDAVGNIVSAYTGTVAFTSSDAVHTLPANYTFTGSDAGSHTFVSGFTLNTVGSAAQTITATDNGNSSIHGSVSIFVSGPATTFLVTPTAATASNPYPDQTHAATSVLVQPLDQFNHEAVSYTGTATFSSSDGAATLGGDPSGCTAPCHVFGAADANGYTLAATFMTVGAQTITATDSTTPTITGHGNVTVTNAPANRLLVTGLTSTESTGVQVPYGVTAVDPYGNVAKSPAYTGTVNLTSSDAKATLTPKSFDFSKGNYAGVTPSGALQVMFITPGSQGVTATDSVTPTITGTGSTTVVTGGPINHFLVEAPSSISANQSFSITIVAQDGNTPALTSNGYTGTVTISSTVPGFVAPAPYTYTAGGSSTDNGVHVFTGLSFPIADSSGTITVTDTGAHTGNSGTINVAGTPTKYVFTSIPASQVIAGSPSQFTFKVEDNSGFVATSYTGTAHFTSTDPLAVLPSNHKFTTGECGVPQAANIDCGVLTVSVTLETAGVQHVTAADTALPQTVAPATSGGVTVAPTTASQLALSAPGSATAGSLVSVVVTARDRYGNTATSYLGTVGFTAPNDARATVPASYTFVGGDNGSHVVSVTFATAGNQVLVGADQAPASGVTPGTSNPVTITAAAPSTYAFSAPATSPAGQPFTLGVDATDQYGNVTPTYTGTVHFTSSDSFATLPGDYTFTSGAGQDNGVHSFTVTLNGINSQTITATDTAHGTMTQTVAVTVTGAASQLIVQMADATAGVPEALTVTAEDPNGQTAASYVGTVHFSSSDGAAALPADYTFTSGDSSMDNGVHTFSVTMNTAGSQSVTATDSANSIVGSTTVTVSTGNAVSLSVSAPATATAGTPVSVVVTAHDVSNNVVAGYTGTVHFTSSDGAAGLPADYTFAAPDSGTHTFSVTLRTVGNQTVTATDVVTHSITGTSAGTAVSAAPAASFTVTAPATATAGTPISVVVTAHDAFGNVATSYAGTVHFKSNDSAAVLPANYAFTTGAGHDNGTHTFSVTLKTAGTSAVTVTDTSASITGTSGNIAVSPLGAATLSVAAPATAASGTPISVSVVARDQYGNTATSYTGTVHLTSTDHAATLPADYTFSGGDAGVHTFSVTLHTTGGHTVTATDTVTPSITGTSANVTVTSGTATHLLVSAPSTAVAGSSISVTVTAEDSSNNTAGGYAGTVHFTSTDSAASLPANYTFTNSDAGTHTFSAVLNTTGGQTVTATDTVTASITGTSGTITITSSAPFHPTGVGAPAVAVAPDGSQLVFWRSANKHLIEAYFQAGSWNGPIDVTSSFLGGGAALSSAPTVAVTSGGTQIVFWQGPNGHLFEAYFAGSWNGPVDVTSSFLHGSAPLTAAPTAAITSGGTQIIFWKGGSGHLYEAYYAGGWNGPVDVTASYFHGANTLTSSPSVALIGSEQVVFWQGASGHLYEAWYAGGWNGPVDWTTGAFGGSAKLTSAPTVAITANGTQLVFWQGASGHLIEAYYASGWHGPVDVTSSYFGGGAALTSAPAAAVAADGTQIVFWQGAGSSLREAWYSGGWHGPVNYSG